MPPVQSRFSSLMLVTILLVVLATACGPAAQPPPAATATAAPAATATPQPPTPTAAEPTVPPTQPPAATATSVPTATATAEPTATPLPALALAEDGLAGWCLPEGVALTAAADPLDPPDNALLGSATDGALEIRNLPAAACTFLFTFNQPAPAGLTLEIYEQRAQTPWLTAELAPQEASPNTAAVTLRHTYITTFPLWEVHYEVVVRDAGGAELHRGPVDLYRWTPELCWNGRRPNPLTLRCPLQQDLHPWDPGYGTPIPTAPPEED